VTGTDGAAVATPAATADPARGDGAVVRRAPGKLFIAGEYAVVDAGNPAVLVAVDRYITARVGDHPGGGVAVRSDLGGRQAHFTWAGHHLRPHDAAAAAGLAHVVAAVEHVAAVLAEHGRPLPRCAIDIESTLHDTGRKYGLGSSGAVTVAVIDAVAAACGLRLTAEERLKLALLATTSLDPRASGGDVAASTYGGWIRYQAPDRARVAALAARAGVAGALAERWPDLAVRRVPPPAGLLLQVGWTGTPASSTALVAGLHARGWRGTAAHAAFTAASNRCVRDLVAALEDKDDAGVLAQIRAARQALAQLDAQAGLGVFTPLLDALVAAAEAAGGAAKPSGDGGGDCGIALLDAEDPARRADLHRRWAEVGVLPLPLGVAAEGDEE
jgi:phosphomevalonate kinase